MGNLIDAAIARSDAQAEGEQRTCHHRIWDLIPARNEWGEPQIWCRCGHVMECPPARLYDAHGKIETGANRRLWNELVIHETARRILAGRV